MRIEGGVKDNLHPQILSTDGDFYKSLSIVFLLSARDVRQLYSSLLYAVYSRAVQSGGADVVPVGSGGGGGGCYSFTTGRSYTAQQPSVAPQTQSEMERQPAGWENIWEKKKIFYFSCLMMVEVICRGNY